jgi:hypothetical protein
MHGWMHALNIQKTLAGGRRRLEEQEEDEDEDEGAGYTSD